jgi:hypothetical protein
VDCGFRIADWVGIWSDVRIMEKQTLEICSEPLSHLREPVRNPQSAIGNVLGLIV